MRSIFPRLLLLIIFSCVSNVFAQESNVPRTSPVSPQFNYQSIELPASDLSKFQLDNWIPIPSEEFDSLIRKIQFATDPADSCSIARSRFSAEYRDGMLLDGSFVFSVRKFGKGIRPLLITPCTIPLREIAWRDRPASGGTSSTGRGIISVDRDSGELVGKWDLAPKHRGRGDEFELEFPQAAVSTFEILVPEEYGIKVNDPSISITKSASEAGKRTWVIELGSRTTFRLEIFKEEKNDDLAPMIVCRQESSYSLRRDGVRLQVQIQISPINGGVSELSFQVDRELQVLSVSLGTDNPLPWEDQLHEKNSRIVKVKFADPLHESGRQLALQFVAPSQVGRDWQLPKVKLLEKVVESHRLSLRIDVPLELKRLTPIDCHQIGIDTADPPIRTFLSDGLDPGLELFVGAPDLRTGCLVAGQVLCDREYWTGEFQLDFRATSGSVFSIPLRIQSGWEIIEVRAGVSSTSALSELVDWDVVNRPDLSQILTIDLQDALKAGSPCQIYVRVRRSAPTGEQAIAVPAIAPAFSTSPLDLLVRILHDRQSSAVLEPGSSFDIVSDDLLPEPWNQSPFFLDRPQEPDRSAFVLKLNGEAVSGDMFVRSTQSNLTGIARVTADFTDDRIQEQMTLKITPQGRIDRVLVYLSESGEERKWSPLNAGALSIDAVRLPSSRHAIWHAPSEGELWELNLSPPQTEAFEIRGTRSSPREDRGRIPLPWLPQADIFEGDVRITASGTDFPRLEVQPGEPLQFSRPNRRTGRGEPRIAEWRYIHSSQQEHTNSITYSYSRKSTATAAPPAASAKVVVRPGRNELSGDLYEIDFEFVTPVLLSQSGLSLPADAELIESTVDGSRCENVRRGDVTLFSVPSATHGRILKIKYSMPTSTKLGRVLCFPQPQFAISQVDWHLILPDGLALSRWPSAWGLADQQPTPVWKQIWSVSTEQTSATDSNSNSFDSLPSDRTMTSRTHSLPAQVELQLWDRTVFVPEAWLSFLICVGFRLVSRQWKFFHARPSLVPGCIVALSLSIYWSPPGWSFVVFAGMIGLIIGTIAPRWWIPPKLEMPQGENRTLAEEGTRIMSLPSSASMLSLAIVLSTSLRAQEISDAKTDDTAIRTTQSTDLQPNPIRQVLIPVPDNVKSDSNPSLLYLSPDWKPLIDRFSGTEELTAEQSYLIRSADHDLHVNDDGDIVYRLVLDIESPDSDFPPELTIPLSNIRFGGEQSCLVDGVPSSIFAVPGKPAVRISLGISSENPDSDRPTVEAKQKLRRRIELRGFPVIKGNEQAWTWESEIPVAVDSLFEANFNRPTEDFQVQSALGAPVWDSEHRHLQVALGSVSKLNIAFHPQASNASADTKVDLLAIGQLEVTPGILNFAYRIKSGLIPSDFGEISLLLPQGTIVRDFSSTMNPVNYSAVSTEVGTLLRCDISEHLSDHIEWNLNFQLIRKGSTDELKVPTIALLAQNSLDHFRLTDHLLAVRVNSNQLIEGPLSPGDAVSQMDVEEFLSKWGPGPDRPQLAVKLTDASPLTFKTSMLASRLISSYDRLRAAVHLHQTDFEWGITTANQANQPRFEYEIDVPSALEVDNVTVTEDGANRLLQWSRRGSRLSLFLREPSTGQQRITVTGHIPLHIPGELPLPKFRIANSDPIAQRIDLEISPELAADWTDSSRLVPISKVESAELNAAGDVQLGSWSTSPDDSGRIALLVQRNVPRVTAQLATVVEKNQEAWRIQSHIIFHVSQGYATQFRLQIPSSLPSPQYFTPGATQSFESLAGETGTIVTLTPAVAVNKEFHAVITYEIPPPQKNRWIVPRISSPDIDFERNFLVINPADLVEESDPAESGLRNGSLSPELTALLPDGILSQARILESYREDDSWVLPLRSQTIRSSSSSSLFAEDRIQFAEGNRIEGRLTLTLTPPVGRRVELAFPELLTLNRLLVNGQLQEPDRKANRVTIRIPGNLDLNRIDVDWIQAKIDRSPLPVSTRIRFPKILYPAVGPRFAMLQFPDDRYDLGVVEGTSVDWWNFVILRSEWLSSQPFPLRFSGEFGETLSDQLQGAKRYWTSRTDSDLTPEDQLRFQRFLEKTENLNSNPAETTPSLKINYPNPVVTRIFRIDPTDEQIGVRLVSRQLVWGLFTIFGILFARFVLPRIASVWINEFADHSPALGWICCGIAWGIFCSPAWGSLLFTFPAVIAWWFTKRQDDLHDAAFLMPNHESTPSEPVG